MFLDARNYDRIMIFILFFFSAVLVISFLIVYMTRDESIVSHTAYDYKKTLERFLITEQEIETYVAQEKYRVDSAIHTLLSRDKEKRTYENTVILYDRIVALSDLVILANILESLSLLHPTEGMRNAARKGKVEIMQYCIDTIAGNEKIYKALYDCLEKMRQEGTVNEQREYCIQQILQNFERAGVMLGKEKKEELLTHLKKIDEEGSLFTQNITLNNETVVVPYAALAGVSDTFIETLKKNEQGEYVLTTDYPTYFTIMEECQNEDTRKQLYHAFQNRGYPANDALLISIIKHRASVAHLLTFNSFAAYDIADQMAQTPQAVHQFLKTLSENIDEKIKEEFT